MSVSSKDHPYFSMTKAARRASSSEYNVHSAVCNYLSYQYPVVRYISNLSGEKFGKGQAQKVSKLQYSPGAPDLVIIRRTEKYVGLCIEIKKERATWYEESGVVYNKNGTVKKDEHLQQQAEWLQYHREQGWYSTFGCGLDECKQIIDDYMKGNL